MSANWLTEAKAAQAPPNESTQGPLGRLGDPLLGRHVAIQEPGGQGDEVLRVDLREEDLDAPVGREDIHSGGGGRKGG